MPKTLLLLSPFQVDAAFSSVSKVFPRFDNLPFLHAFPDFLAALCAFRISICMRGA